MNDLERQDLPSASGFEVDALCPGRNQLLRSLPNVQEPPDEFAERGTRIHKARETMDPSSLNEEDRDIFELGFKTEINIVGQWVQDFGIRAYIEGPREKRVWIHWEDTAQRATSAQMDVHYIAPGDFLRVLVIDWKALWARSVTAAERNYQARVQAVCAQQDTDARHVRVSFNKAMFGKSDTVDYTEGDLTKALASIYQALWETKQQGAPRRAGPHCNYCPCKAYCREAVAYSMIPSVTGGGKVAVQRVSTEMDKEDISGMITTLPIEDLARIFGRSAIVAKIILAVRDRMKTLNEVELSSLGYMKKKGRRMDKITDTKGAFDFLKLYGISEEELWSALRFSKDELVDAIRRDQGLKRDAVMGLIDGRLDPFITRDNAEDSIVPLA